MERVIQIVTTFAEVILPGYFWIRGVVKNRNSDMGLAVGLAVILAVFGSASRHGTPFNPMNELGLLYMGMGVTLLFVGLVWRTERPSKVILTSVEYIGLGFFLFLLMT